MICVGTQPFVRAGWVQEDEDKERWGDRGVMSSLVGTGRGLAVAGAVLHLGFCEGKGWRRWNDVGHGE